MKKRITAFVMAAMVSLTPFASYAAEPDALDIEPAPQENQQETEAPEKESPVTEPEEVKSVDEQLNNEDKEVSENKQEDEVPAEETETPAKAETEESTETSKDKAAGDDKEEATYTVSFYDSIDEKVFATVDVSENGSVEELPEAPEHEGYEFKEYEGTYTDVIADETVTAVYEVTEEEAAEDTLVYTELSETVGDYAISAVGNMPDGTKLVASMIENDSDVEKTVCDSVEGMTFKAQVSFDIKLMDGDKEYQPIESDETVKISINHINSDSDIAVFRITDDGAVTNMNASVSGETVDFVTDHFTTYTVGEASYESTSTGKWLGFDYSLYDTDGDGIEDTCVLTGEQTEENISANEKRDFVSSGINHVVVKNAKIFNGQYLFSNYRDVISITFENVDTSNVSTMEKMFHCCYKLESLDLSSFNTSNVANMCSMFSECHSLVSLNVSHFDTSNVTSMSCMFAYCGSLKNLDVSHFDTSNVNSMSMMFWGCSSLNDLNVSYFDTSNVTNMRQMFFACNLLTVIDVSHFNTSKVTDMRGMFDACYALTELNVSSFNTSKVTDMKDMFFNCRKLAMLDLNSFDTSNVTDMQGMFKYCKSLENLNIHNFDTSKVTDMESMFEYCESLPVIDVSRFNTSNVTSMFNMFANCRSLTNLDLSSFDASKVTYMHDIVASTNLDVIYTPKNINVKDIRVSGEVMYPTDKKEAYRYFPTGLDKSIELRKGYEVRAYANIDDARFFNWKNYEFEIIAFYGEDVSSEFIKYNAIVFYGHKGDSVSYDDSELKYVTNKLGVYITPKSVTITYVDLNGKTIATINQEPGSEISLPEQYIRKLKDIEYYDSNGNKISTVPNEDTTVTVRFDHVASANICLPYQVDGEWVFSDEAYESTNPKENSYKLTVNIHSNYIYYSNATVSDQISTKYYSYTGDDLNKYITVEGRDLSNDLFVFESDNDYAIYVDGRTVYYTDLHTGIKFAGNLDSAKWYVAKEDGDQLWNINGKIEWKKVSNVITYVDGEGNIIAKIVQDVDSEIGLPEEYTKGHKDIKYHDVDGNEVTTVSDADDAIVYVNWTEVKDDNTNNNPNDNDAGNNENSNKNSSENGNSNGNITPNNNTSSDSNSNEASNASENTEIANNNTTNSNIVSSMVILPDDDNSAIDQTAAGADSLNGRIINNIRSYVTGDDSQMAVRLMIMIVAMGALAGVYMQNKKKNNK